MDKTKLYLKSNKKCSICNQNIDIKENFIAVKTKRNTFKIAHYNCIYKSL